MTDNPRKLCFVVGAIGGEDTEIRDHADWLLEMIIQPVMEKFDGFHVKRADQDHRPGLIDAHIINDLLTADLVIADLSGLNPNAFYEIGIRHMAQKPIIHMQLAEEKIPFDVSLYRAIKFSRKRPKDIRTAQEILALQVEAVLADDYQVENPVTNARGRVYLETHATPGQQVIVDQLRGIEQRLSAIELINDFDSENFIKTPMEAYNSSVPDDYISFFSIGDSVRHEKFGQGRVIKVVKNAITVVFSNGKSKRILDSFLQTAP